MIFKKMYPSIVLAVAGVVPALAFPHLPGLGKRATYTDGLCSLWCRLSSRLTAL
jgi:hypothetical protein